MPDLAQSIGTDSGSDSPFAGREDLVVYAVLTGQSAEVGFEHLASTGTMLPCLIDEDQSVYDSYSRGEAEGSWAPFPVQVVIDRDGIVRYLSFEYEVDALTRAISEALGE